MVSEFREKKMNGKVILFDKSEDKKIPYTFMLLALIIIIQAGFIVYLAYNVIYIIPNELNQTKIILNRNIDNSNKELESKITELTKGLSQAKTEQSDLGKQISLMQAETSSDFSGLIQTSVKSVVTVRSDVAQGTGFIITPDGYIVTNAHVLKGATYADAVTSNKKVIGMELIGYNNDSDIALLKIDGTYDYLELRDSSDIRVGEKVIAIGNPLGLSFSVTEGIVSAINRKGDNGLPAYVQTDAALNPGNSGGPLIGTDGKVIGINNFKANAENIGFALESNYMKDTINEIALQKLNRTILE